MSCLAVDTAQIEIGRSHVEFKEKIGAGAFGDVQKVRCSWGTEQHSLINIDAYAQGLYQGAQVAIKTFKAEGMCAAEFMCEAYKMQAVRIGIICWCRDRTAHFFVSTSQFKHEHVAELIGVCTVGMPMFILLAYMVPSAPFILSPNACPFLCLLCRFQWFVSFAH